MFLRVLSAFALYLMLLTVFMQSIAFAKNADRIPKIAIIGAGIGGASTAHFLRELFGRDGAHIHVYEAGKIGGRLATTKIANKYFESGGSILHPKNKYMVDFMTSLGLEKNGGKQSLIALYDGDEFVFRSSDYYLVSIMRLLWRYGLGPIKLDGFINTMLDNFGRIYELQERGESFETVEDLLRAMSPSFVDALTNTTYEGMKREYLSDVTIKELVEASLRVNYGQDINAHLFVGCVSVAGATHELFSIKGGNKQVPEKLLKAAKVTFVPGQVRSITLSTTIGGSPPYILNYTLNYPDISVNVEKTEFYDIVIVATPQTDDMKYKINFINFNKEIRFPGSYHRTVCTLIHGEINQNFFGLIEDNVIYDILSINNRTIFNSVSQILSVDRLKTRGQVWKVFSQGILTEKQISLLFSKVEHKEVIDWLAYPNYDTTNRVDKFILHDKIFHVNAIEFAASAMEMSAIGAKNVALLAFKAWMGKTLPNKNDSEPDFKKRKYDL